MATREVVVSAGVFRSPQLLMQFNIPNLQDRPLVGSTYQINMNTSSQEFNAENVAFFNSTYFASPPTGILTGTVDITSFENVPPEFNLTLSPATQAAITALPPDWPVFQYLPVNGDLLLFRSIASKPPTSTAVVPNYGSIAAAVAAPQSRGSVSIRSADFSDPPVIDIGYLNDPADVELLMVAFKRSRQAWRSPAIRPALVGDEYWPGYDLVPDGDDEAIRNHVVENVMPIWEAMGTCAMGTDASNGVVDSLARVFGARGLRVADASALPFSLPGHPASSVFGLAERVAEWVKEDFGTGQGAAAVRDR
ncbi:GMC oxidoreductase-domain-containing protein [Diplogelasinospora grovesii]|uniref:GMC oxidoreductase-domain-containing protein n=1 Tax=Diplogelasinospora grovesii TaxID=303347 RepID=A0AAN6MVA9_9PEZI|nr:GMC oxidoreductase-domain-containing protein [Diplogelasinospora grovesii]